MKTTPLSRVLVIVAGLGLASAARAQAQDAGAARAPVAATAQKQQAWQRYCLPDVEKFCKDAIAKDTVPECLAAKETELTEECQRSFLYKYRVAQICREDIEKTCKPKMATGMTLGACFKGHRKEFSQKCQDAIEKGQKQFKAEKRAEAKMEKAENKAEAAEAKATAKVAKKKRKAAEAAAK